MGSSKLRVITFEDSVKENRREEFKIQLSPHFSTYSAGYTGMVDALLSSLYHAVVTNKNRSLVIKALEIIAKVAAVSENVSLFNSCPSPYLHSLVTALTTSYAYSGSLVTNAGQKSASFILSAHYNDQLDTDLRDVALDIIHSLCTSSASLQDRFCDTTTPQLLKSLFLLVKSSRMDRGIAVTKAFQLLTLLVSRGLSLGQSELNVALAAESFRDENLAEAICSNTWLFNKAGDKFY